MSKPISERLADVEARLNEIEPQALRDDVNALKKIVYGNGSDGLKDRIVKMEVRTTIVATAIGVVVGTLAQVLVKVLVK